MAIQEFAKADTAEAIRNAGMRRKRRLDLTPTMGQLIIKHTVTDLIAESAPTRRHDTPYR